jgi:hypothetical protein
MSRKPARHPSPRFDISEHDGGIIAHAVTAKQAAELLGVSITMLTEAVNELGALNNDDICVTRTGDTLSGALQ